MKDKMIDMTGRSILDVWPNANTKHIKVEKVEFEGKFYHQYTNTETNEVIIDNQPLNFIKTQTGFIPSAAIADPKKYELQQVVHSLLLAKRYPDARDAIVEFVMKNNHIITERVDSDPLMLIYKEGIYIPEARTYIRELCEYACGLGYTKNISNEVIARIEAKTYRDLKDLYEVKDPYQIAVQNGILDIRSKTVLPFDPKIVFFTKLPITFNPEASCPRILEFLNNTLQEQDIPIIQEQLGYTLIRNYAVPKAFLYSGSGRNGKSQVIELTKEFLGHENVTGVSLQDLGEDQYAAGELFGKLACLGGDLSNTMLKNTGVFKQLTGGDLIAANRKFLTRLLFKNYAKLIFSANQPPVTNDTSDGFYARWIIIEFPYKFYTAEEIEAMPEEEKANVKPAVRDIVKTICTSEELSGLLNWALSGAQRIIDKGNFSYAQTTEMLKRTYMRKSNSLAAFVQEHCALDDPTASTLKEDFKNLYAQYCAQYQLPMRTEKAIAKYMKDNEVWQGKSGAVRTWNGIKINLQLGQVGRLGQGFPTAREVKNNLGDTEMVSKSSKSSKVDEALEFLRSKNAGKGVTIDYLLKMVPGLLESDIFFLEQRGDVFFPTPGWVKAL